MVSCAPTASPVANGEPATYQIEIDLLGTIHEVSADTQGRIKTNVELSSADGKVSLSLKEGTIVMDKDGKPLELIHVAIDPTLPLPPEDAYIIEVVYDLKPEGATFDPPFKLTISYDPEELPEGVRESEVYIASYDESSGWDVWQYKKVDTKNHRVTTQVSYLAKHAILVPGELTSPTPSPAPSLTPDLASTPLTQVLGNGKPTLAEFGASTCIPCKQMKPILEQLAIEYEGKLNVVIVEVYEQMELTRSYSIMTIPTQIAFDSSGKEITRHIGLWPKEEIVAQLKKMGVD
jgi:thioredoxin 1